ncbi:MAG: twin-arginine translocase subunit TatC [Candidatus Coatesbacteria bacterium]|nr:twin-arginine translocase subunit TatC [Candidatus Coatesbacteria bacterium]
MSKKETEQNLDYEMPFEEHLEELRHRLFKCLIAVLVFMIISYVFINRIVIFLRKPLGDYKLIFLSPNEAFMAYIKLALYCGLIFAVPVIIYQLWRFISIALFPRERHALISYVPVSMLLFLTGAAFAYYVALPIGLKFLLTFPPEDANIEPMLSLSKYFGFVGMFILGFGLLFQLPMIIIILTRLGIIAPKTLSGKRRHIILAIFIIAAIFSPPDVITQSLLAIPLVFLFEISIWLSYLFARRRKKELEE